MRGIQSKDFKRAFLKRGLDTWWSLTQTFFFQNMFAFMNKDMLISLECRYEY